MPSHQFENVEAVSDHLKEMLGDDDAKIFSLYAFNATGKTRLAGTFNNSIEDLGIESEQVYSLNYSAHFEDLFVWDNTTNELRCSEGAHFIWQTLKDENLENTVSDYFQQLANSHIEPNFNFETNTITFSHASGDDEAADSIKVSRGEESLLIWSIFYVILECAVENLEMSPDNRSSTLFNYLKYVVIDDPVSSIDDTRIVNTALQVDSISKKLQKLGVSVIILTHHTLFYSVLLHSMRKLKSKNKFQLYSLKKNSDNTLELRDENDAPFAYHLQVIDVLKSAIDQDNINRSHFNMYRALLEKTASFFGVSDWSQCLADEYRDLTKRMLDTYSHARLSELEPRDLHERDKELFAHSFKGFLDRYNWS